MNLHVHTCASPFYVSTSFGILYLTLYCSVPDKSLKHNSRFWPACALTLGYKLHKFVWHWPIEVWYMGAYPRVGAAQDTMILFNMVWWLVYLEFLGINLLLSIGVEQCHVSVRQSLLQCPIREVSLLLSTGVNILQGLVRKCDLLSSIREVFLTLATKMCW